MLVSGLEFEVEETVPDDVRATLGTTGAFVFTVVSNFAIYVFFPDRFNTLIGLVFLLVVLFLPDGLAGAGRRLALLLGLLTRDRSTASGSAAPASPVRAGTAATENIRGEVP